MSLSELKCEYDNMTDSEFDIFIRHLSETDNKLDKLMVDTILQLTDKGFTISDLNKDNSKFIFLKRRFEVL